ncbi:MAG TPA: FAD-binding oxidoreductase [Jatrophihabitans sp.]|nr:FAD-binding oxidoreductase [Jatrophihabitans sp.]
MTTTTQHQSRTVIGDATVAELEGALRGTVVRPGDAGYDEARAIWNASHDKHPALIIRCAGTADVMKAVQFARSQQLPVAVRGGAHSIAGFSTVDDGVVIDLSPMRGVTVDPVNRRAVVQGGATWHEVDHETQAFGLAVTGGLVSSTGVGGFTLGGGIGWLVRKHGLSCDNIVSADVVTSDGELVHAGPVDNPELFWALRGGGGNFGIVTSFEYDLHPVGPDVTAGLIFFPGAAARDVLRGWRDLTGSMPRELTSLVNLTTAPPVPFLPEAVHGTPIVAIALMHCGPLADGERAVAPLRALAEPILDIVGPMPYAAMQQVLDPLWARGAHNYFTSAFVDTLSDEVLEEVIGRWQHKPTPQSELHLHHIAGAMGDVSADATAFAHRSSPFICNVIARATDGQDFDSRAAWARAARDTLATYGNNGVYVNFTGDGDADKVRAAYPPDTYARLAGVKRHYDPDNVFRLNQNISPTP